MSEKTGSRYSIMEELNNRKITTKEKLANIERTIDEKEYSSNIALAQLKQQKEEENRTFEFRHKDKVRNIEVILKTLSYDCERKKAGFKQDIADEKDNYKQVHMEEIDRINEEISKEEKVIKRYLEIQALKVKEKKEIIKEIESGINSLKEMSAEQQKDKE